MPELDKNYIAGLYLDEITLDVMPQEYIDAALEVKLRYDACAPRAGYNCVQDRRVKGGFYYRKAPQGQGVNALPPSKLERALARSQEQPTQRSGLSFLSKAAIGAGVAIGGLALTGAVVNAGRSSEPYQEPVRQKPEKAKTSYNAAAIGVAGVAATSVGAAGLGLKRKPPLQSIEVQGESAPPTESGQPTAQKSQAEIARSPKEARRKWRQVQPPQASPPVVKTEDPVAPPAEKPNTAPAYIASKVSTLYGGQNTTRNGFEELDAIRGKKTFSAYSDEEIDNAIASSPIQKMQVKGKTYIRDLDKVDEGVLLNEAVNLRKASSKVNTIKAPEVRRLLEARDHKAANLSKKKDPTPEEKEAFSKLDKAVEEMRTAIGDREKNPVRSGKVRPEKKPQAEDLGGDSGEGGGKNVRGESSKVKKAAADRAKQQETPDIEPPVVARSEEQIAADRVATERAKQAKDQEAKQSKREGMAALAETRLTEKGIELSIKKQQKQIDGDEFNVEVEKLRQNPATVRAVEKAIEPIANEYDDRIAQVSNEAKRKSLEKEKAAKVEEQTLETYRGLQIPDPLQVKPPAPTAEKAALDKKATNKGIPVTPPLAPNLSVENVDFKEPEYRGKEISNLSEAITKAKGSIPILVSQKDPIRYEAQGEISNLITYGASMAKDRDNETVRAFPYVLPKDKDIADAMLRQQDILYREPSDITPALSQSKIRGQASLTSSLDLENLVPTKSIDRYDPKTIESLAQDFTKVGGTIKPIVTIQKDPLSHEIVDGHLQYYAAKKAAEINPQYANIRSYPAEDMNHAEAIVAQYEAVRKAIAETDAVKAAVAPKAVRSPSSKPITESPNPVKPSSAKDALKSAIAYKPLSPLEIQKMSLEEQSKYYLSSIERANVVKRELEDGGAIVSGRDILSYVEEQKTLANNERRKITNLGYKDEADLSGDLIGVGLDPMYSSPKEDRIKALLPFVNPKGEIENKPQSLVNKPAGSGKRSAIAEGLNITAEDEARYASISGSTVSASTLKGNEMLGKINTRMSFLQDQRKADRIEALLDKANKGEFVSQSDIDAVIIDFDGNYSPSDLKSEQAKSDISRGLSRLRLSEDVGEKPERRAKRMLLEVAGLASDPERLTSYLSSPKNYSAFKAGTKDDLNTVDYMSSQEKSQLESLIKNTFNTSAIAAYKRGENYSNKDLQRVYKDLTGKRLSLTAAQKKAADKAEQVNDAIAPSEEYLSAYYETRNKYRRVS